ncbi:GGDEF domain-containing protein [Clostridium aminobutyricum]|uniref:GGDEF domain-containing protein n=1 Tax=Clostridium aminobutyricum TaxID=33953 RepID=A0A939IH63_CLOAM|nr:GGDEF domain-containing protein [Clostridium aminobutyricum]MBN7773217.1 GGDEF domain-containing protein [Clostridium aminobutyricum]
MEEFLYAQINIVGFIILAILLTNQKKSVGITIQQELFNTLIIAAMYILVLDSGMWLIDGKTFSFARELNFLISTAYYFLCGFISFIWLLYSDCKLNNTIRHLRNRLLVYFVPLLIDIVVIAYNLGSGLIFSIDAHNVYHRGEWVIIPVILSFSYLICSFVLSVHKGYSSKIAGDKRQAYLMAFFALPPVIGIMVQSIFSEVSLIWISTVISLLMIFVNIQNQQINTDSLTGLNNRLQFDKYLYFKTRDTDYKDVIALIMIDVDKFKQINDSYGHLAGDKALICVADILKKSCKNKNVFLSRYGGDEFAVVYQTRQLSNVQKLIELLHQNTHTFNRTNSEVFSVSLSIGYAVWERNSSIDRLIAQADHNMYQAKRRKA